MISEDTLPAATVAAAVGAESPVVLCFLFAPCTPSSAPILVSLRLAFFLISTVTAGIDALKLPLLLLLLLDVPLLLLFAIA